MTSKDSAWCVDVCLRAGTTVTMSIVAAACAAAATFPASSIQARVGVSMAVSSAAIVASSAAVVCFTTVRIDPEVAVAVISAAAMSVAFAAAWAVGVMVGMGVLFFLMLRQEKRLTL